MKWGIPLTDSWEEIINAAKEGTYKEKYVIGDTKELDLGAEGTITMKLVAFDSDELADGSGYASMSWVAVDLLNTEYAMNKYGTLSGGWPKSDLNEWLNSYLLRQFPEDVWHSIKMVRKYSFSYMPEEMTESSTGWIC